MASPRIVVMGGGTGTFTILSGLKHHPVDLSVIVSIADNGGSTGILRDELGVLPPGDIRQCLVALSAGDDVMRRLFTYRFSEGSLSGHNAGNLFLSALEKVTGDSLSAIREAHRILNVGGRVIPVSGQAANLFAELEDGTVVEGEHEIDEPATDRAAIHRCFLSPNVTANPEAIEAIKQADLVVFGPGDLYTSIVPVLLVEGIADALRQTRAKRVFVLNLVTKNGQTDGYTAKKFCEVIARTIAPAPLTAVLVNTGVLPADILSRYEQLHEHPVKDDLGNMYHAVRTPFLSDDFYELGKGDVLRRSLLRHDPKKLAQAVVDLLSCT